MPIADMLEESARACEGAAHALAHVLRPAVKKPDPTSNVLSTFHEAQAFAITCRAVLDEAAPIIPYLSSTAKCAGKFGTDLSSDIYACNGYDTLAVILIMLLDNATQAILDVAANHSRWLISPLQAGVCMERMVTHHGQLRAFYGIMHLAAKILSYSRDVSKTLFVDINEETETDMKPSKWRAAIKLDDFYGRHFGFHYTPEMRNVLRVVNIFRGSVIKSHTESDSTPQIFKNAVMLGWGWLYSNMVIMDNLGLTIDGVSQIGADIEPNALTIQQLRKFMNLVEEPLVAGVSGLASADVALDNSFEIPPPGEADGLEIASNMSTDALRDVLISITEPVKVRLLSYKGRPLDLPPHRTKHNTVSSKNRQSDRDPPQEKGSPQSARKPQRKEMTQKDRTSQGTATIHKESSPQSRGPPKARKTPQASQSPQPEGSLQDEETSHDKETCQATETLKHEEQVLEKQVSRGVGNSQGESSSVQEQQMIASSNPDTVMVVSDIGDLNVAPVPVNEGVPLKQLSGKSQAEDTHVKTPIKNTKSKTQTSSSFVTDQKIIVTGADKLDNSFLATTIKTELKRLQSNVSNLLGIEAKKPASGLVMHFHGGGFVSQSSESHAVYMREWCVDVPDSIVVSVDYKLAPEYQFPKAVHECIYAYVWALQHASRIGTLAERVVFTGDSAGGNLAIATALKIAEVGIRCADGICVAYPALYVTTAWSPSRLLSFFDPLLPVSVLELCMKSYVPDNVDASKNAMISPIVASDEQLKRLPPVTVICGSLDPLLDDAAIFAQRLHDLRDGDVFRVYQSLPHGFLNLNQVNVLARTAMHFLSKMIAKYLNVPLRNISRRGDKDNSAHDHSKAEFSSAHNE